MVSKVSAQKKGGGGGGGGGSYNSYKYVFKFGSKWYSPPRSYVQFVHNPGVFTEWHIGKIVIFTPDYEI